MEKVIRLKKTNLSVLFINQYYTPDTSATAKILKNTTEKLSERFSVKIIAGRPSYHPDKFHKKYIFSKSNVNGVVVERVGSSAFSRHKMSGRISNYLSFLLLAMIRALIIKADIIVSMTDPPLAGLVGAITSKIKKKKFIYSIQDLHPDMALASGLVKYGAFVKIWEKTHQWVLKSANAIIVIGDDMRQRIIDKGVNPEKIFVIRHGAKNIAKKFENGKEIEELINGQFSFSLVHAGNIGFYGAWETLIEAVVNLEKENVGLTFIGNGAAKERLKILAENSPNINFLPLRPSAEIPFVLSAGDIHVVSIKKGLEGMVVPSKIYPLLYAGRPILALAPEDSDAAKIVKMYGCGIVADPTDPESLSKSIRKIAKNKKLLKEMGRCSKEAANKFNLERSIEQLANLVVNVDNIGKGTEKTVKIVRVISRLNVGGPAIHVKMLNSGLKKPDYETVLITGKISPSEGDMGYIFENEINIPKIIPELQREINPAKDLKAFIKILKLIAKEKPDILHTHAAKAGIVRIAATMYNLFSFKKVKKVHTFHGNVFEGYFSSVKSQMFIKIERMLSKTTDAVIAISESQRQDLLKKYYISDEKRIRKVELGFDLLPFTSCADRRGIIRRRLGISEDVLLVGIVGRLVPIKNHRLFIEAARILSKGLNDEKIRFLVVGDGELRNDLETIAKKLGLKDRFAFTGWIRDVFEVYADIDVLALTSINEGTPVSIIEAMASGVPVVATDAGGVRDLLGPFQLGVESSGVRICERGILCTKYDPEQFAQAMEIQIRSSMGEREQRLEAARRFVVENYDQKRLIRDIEALYLELLSADVTAT